MDRPVVSSNKSLQRIVLQFGFLGTGADIIRENLVHHREDLAQNDITVINLEECECEPDRGWGSTFRMLRRLNRRLKQAQSTVVMAAEAMSRWSPNRVAKLSRLLKRFTDEVMVIAYLPNHDEYAVSLLEQTLKNPSIGRLFGDSSMILPLPDVEGIRYLSFSGRLECWSDAFGRDAISIVTMDYLKLRGQHLLDNFCQQTGITRSLLGTELARPDSIGYYRQLFVMRHRHLLASNGLLYKRFLAVLPYLACRDEQKLPSDSEIDNFRSLFKDDVNKLKVFKGDAVVFNVFKRSADPFRFSHDQYLTIKQACLDLYCHIAIDLYRNNRLAAADLRGQANLLMNISALHALRICNFLSDWRVQRLERKIIAIAAG